MWSVHIDSLKCMHFAQQNPHKNKQVFIRHKKRNNRHKLCLAKNVAHKILLLHNEYEIEVLFCVEFSQAPTRRSSILGTQFPQPSFTFRSPFMISFQSTRWQNKTIPQAIKAIYSTTSTQHFPLFCANRNLPKSHH